jgi:DNA-binding transcriptional MocR family regulator
MKGALADSVSIVHGQPFYADHAGDRELRLCFSGVPIGRADELARRLLQVIAAVRRETGASPPLMAIV